MDHVGNHAKKDEMTFTRWEKFVMVALGGRLINLQVDVGS